MKESVGDCEKEKGSIFYSTGNIHPCYNILLKNTFVRQHNGGIWYGTERMKPLVIKRTL